MGVHDIVAIAEIWLKDGWDWQLHIPHWRISRLQVAMLHPGVKVKHGGGGLQLEGKRSGGFALAQSKITLLHYLGRIS